ncbi:lysozyme inhibitor LprI family protein [Motilimonas cestriensis]|uniref:lysozyme inhibitor LprI family protein n=1 Tax=Motilimonas cestriensis TaxID=2742685 RepID=UPI003DA4E9C7
MNRETSYIIPLLFSALCLGSLGSVHASPNQATVEKSQTKMHPSWDSDHDGINDCENDGSCDHTIDYSQPRDNANSAHSSIAVQPTFDCQQEKLSSAEKLICSDSTLAQYDQAMATTFKSALAKIDTTADRKRFQATQRGWIKGRNECWKEPDLKQCIEYNYKHRQAEIEAQYNLVGSSVPVHYTCKEGSSNDFVVTYFATTPPTAKVEHGETTQLLFRRETPTGLVYDAGDYILKEHNGNANIQWGYNTESLNCAVKQ